jgi:hypothetical protein
MNPIPFGRLPLRYAGTSVPKPSKTVNADKKPVSRLLLEITLQFQRALSGCTILSGLG